MLSAYLLNWYSKGLQLLCKGTYLCIQISSIIDITYCCCSIFNMIHHLILSFRYELFKLLQWFGISLAGSHQQIWFDWGLGIGVRSSASSNEGRDECEACCRRRNGWWRKAYLQFEVFYHFHMDGIWLAFLFNCSTEMY